MRLLHFVGVAFLGELGSPTPEVSLELLHSRLELRLILGARDAPSLSKGAQP